MKKLLLFFACLLPLIGYAQTYPSPTFQSLTLLSPLSAASGGTGVANGSTLTLGGPFITSGSSTLTLTTTGTTALTLPTAGTLLTSAGASAIYAPIASPTFTGTVTIPSGASISGYAPLASPTFTGTVTSPSITLTPSTTTPSANGQLVAQSSQNAMQTEQGSLTTYVPNSLFVGTASVTTSGTTAISLIPTGVGTITIPANYLVPGKTVSIRFAGTIVTAATPGTLIFSFAVGSSTIVTTSAVTPTASTTSVFDGEIYVTTRTTGSSGTSSYFVKISYNNTTTPGVLASGSSTATINTTISNNLTLTSTNSVSGGAVLTVNEVTMSIIE